MAAPGGRAGWARAGGGGGEALGAGGRVCVCFARVLGLAVFTAGIRGGRLSSGAVEIPCLSSSSQMRSLIHDDRSLSPRAISIAASTDSGTCVPTGFRHPLTVFTRPISRRSLYGPGQTSLPQRDAASRP